MQGREKPESQFDDVRQHIAWLSVCMLAAGLGGQFDTELQHLWADLGAFGLAAALGLEAVHRFRKNRASLLRDSAMRSRLELGLSRLSEESATLDSLHVAVRRLTDDVIGRKGCPACDPPTSKRQWEAELLRGRPLSIAPVDGSDETAHCNAAAIVQGHLRQISSTAISFDHEQPLGVRVAMLTFTLNRDRQLAFVVDVIWTEPTNDGYLSGGTMLAVGVPPQSTAPSHEEVAVAVG